MKFVQLCVLRWAFGIFIPMFNFYDNWKWKLTKKILFLIEKNCWSVSIIIIYKKRLNNLAELFMCNVKTRAWMHDWYVINHQIIYNFKKKTKTKTKL